MSKVFFYSIFTKGIGSILEIVLQIVIIRFISMNGYGEYSYYIGLADVGYWIFFSAITKCNIFYGSQKEGSIAGFSKKYYIRYVVPVLLVCFFASICSTDRMLPFVAAILMMETMVLDMSSQLLAGERYHLSLMGEYCLGRAVILTFTIVLGLLNKLSIHVLLLLYLLQYVCVYLVFVIRRRKRETLDEISIPIKKVMTYQYGDILYGLIQRAPVILEYLFTGAFFAGFINLLTLVRTVVAFVSGPTSKVFMPSFARLYQNGEKEKLVGLYQRVMLLQMIFMTAISVVLLGFSEYILQLFSSDLVGYTEAFSGISICFLIALSFGPCSSLMQMTGNEEKDTIIRSISVVLMVFVWLVSRKTEMFVLYGIGVQILSEYFMDYFMISKILGRMPIGVIKYVMLWCPAVLVIIFVRASYLSQNILTMLVSVLIAVLLYGGMQLLDKQVRAWIKEEVLYGIIKK